MRHRRARRRGRKIYVDGLGAHRSRAARDAVEARGATYELLPPYSPDMTPVEEACGKVETLRRGRNPRARAALDAALGDTLDAITPRDARGWFVDRDAYTRIRPEFGGTSSVHNAARRRTLGGVTWALADERRAAM